MGLFTFRCFRYIYVLCIVLTLFTLLYEFYLLTPSTATGSLAIDDLPLIDFPSEEQKGEYCQPPLSTRGRDIIDARGERCKLVSVNWYGGSDELFIPGGLDVQPRYEIAETIRKLGFNSVRLPYSDEMVMLNPLIDPSLLLSNQDLVGLRALDVFQAVVKSLTEVGIMVIVNNHITQATWCCGANPCDLSWHNDQYGPLCRVKQTESMWLNNWEVMLPFLNDSLVIGADLRNEVRGLWLTMTWDKWATAAEKAGNRLLKLRPDWIIFVEGVSSANDLTGVRDRPVVLDIEDRVVYSSHVYGWSGWGSLGGTYSQRSYESFVESMQENWGYLLDENIAPVWVGEFGGPHLPNVGDINYWNNLMRYLEETEADFAYWAINPRKPHDNEYESYSLVEDDWQTPVLDYRMRDMIKLMRSEDKRQDSA